MVTTDDEDMAARMRIFRNHGITNDHRERELQGSFRYEMVDLGYNYRITDIQCVLGLSQLKKLPSFISRRRAIAAKYDAAFANNKAVSVLGVHEDVLPVDRARDWSKVRIPFLGSVAQDLLPFAVEGSACDIQSLRDVADRLGRHSIFLPVNDLASEFVPVRVGFVPRGVPFCHGFVYDGFDPMLRDTEVGGDLVDDAVRARGKLLEGLCADLVRASEESESHRRFCSVREIL